MRGVPAQFAHIKRAGCCDPHVVSNDLRLRPVPRRVESHAHPPSTKFRQARHQAGLRHELVLYCGRHDFGTRLYAKTGNPKLAMAPDGAQGRENGHALPAP